MKTKSFAPLLTPFIAACTSGPIGKAALDDEVRSLCAIDGGVKVYRTVSLPAEHFDRYGNVKIPSKENGKSGDEYYRKCDVHYYRRGNPEVSRDHFKIIRRSDGKVLGEAIYCGRGGGDLVGPWHGSSFTCPDPTMRPSLESSIFVREESKCSLNNWFGVSLPGYNGDALTKHANSWAEAIPPKQLWRPDLEISMNVPEPYYTYGKVALAGSIDLNRKKIANNRTMLADGARR